MGAPTHKHYSDFNIRNQKCYKISLLTTVSILIDLFPSFVVKWVSGAKYSPWEKKYL